MRILAIDQATKSGWCSPNGSGVWDLTPNRGESIGMRNVRFRAKLKELIELEDIEMVCYERPAGRHKSSLVVAGELISIIKLVCEDMGVEYGCYSASEIKKYATGKGNANKDAMIQSAERYGVEIIDDNHADALHLWNMVNEEINR